MEGVTPRECVRTVAKPSVLSALKISTSEKQIPQVVGIVEN
jgi:hypothetical protein